jgi:hypothetical protein
MRAITFFFFAVALLIGGLSVDTLAQCTITPSSTTMCAGQAYGFSTDSDGSVFTWYLNGSPVSGYNGSFAYITFPYSSDNQSYQISGTVSGDNGGGDGGIQLQATRFVSSFCTPPAINVNVSGSSSPWQATAYKTVLYGPGDVTLSTVFPVPSDQHQYLSWHSDPAGYSASGSSFTATGITTSTNFYLDYNGPNCYSRTQVFVSVLPPLCPITTNATSFCVGKTYNFDTSVTGPPGKSYAYLWSVDGNLISNIDNQVNTQSSVSITFTQAGNKTISVSLSEQTGGGGDGGIYPTNAQVGVQGTSINCTPQDITVAVSNTTTLVPQASTTNQVGPGTVHLSTTIPASEKSFLRWTSNRNHSLPAGQTDVDYAATVSKGSQLVTTTYEPLIGITSCTDANNQTSIFSMMLWEDYC